jgi:ATP-binding cassette subfamily C protein CydC
MIENFQGLADILAFGRERDRLKLVDMLAGEYAQSQRLMARIGGFYNGMGIALTNLGMMAVLILGIQDVNSEALPGVMLAALTMIALSSFESVVPLAQTAQILPTAISSATRLFALVESEPHVEVQTKSTPELLIPPEVVMTDLAFSYPGSSRPALRSFNARLSPGSSLAIVGPSGAGKTSLLNLLLGFWDYLEGEVRLDDYHLRDLDPEFVRSLIAVVPQRPYFFNATVEDNLRLAKQDATRSEIERAALQAQIHSFIKGLPEGYDTFIGERGLRLSGGERQRLSLTRALLKDCPILILDEPTANLDPITERTLVKNLLALTEQRTRSGWERSTILITHRLIGLESVDEIIVLDQGEIVERGSQADLVHKQGLFYRMLEDQKRLLIP